MLSSLLLSSSVIRLMTSLSGRCERDKTVALPPKQWGFREEMF
jgi:hypothetical protein